jgi:hypothetical protein
MYVRWVVRRHKNAAIANTSFHDAYLVESYRDDKGRPRQRTICYLGNIRQIDEGFPAIERELFLLRAERILLGIEGLSGDDRARVMDMLHQKVYPLTTTEVMAAFTENLRWYRRWLDENDMSLSDEELLHIVRDSKGQPGPL